MIEFIDAAVGGTVRTRNAVTRNKAVTRNAVTADVTLGGNAVLLQGVVVALQDRVEVLERQVKALLALVSASRLEEPSSTVTVVVPDDRKGKAAARVRAWRARKKGDAECR